MMHTHSTVAVLDFGSQYTQLIARRIREQNVYSEILPHTLSVDEIRRKKVEAIILSGGPSSVYAEGSPQLDEKILEEGIPVLGICYGLHLLIAHSGGMVQHKGQGEYGFSTIQSNGGSPLFQEVKNSTRVWMSHGDEIDSLGEGYEIIARSSNDIVAAIQHREKPIYGVQFHPEVAHTSEGKTIISNFLFKVANCSADWTAANFVSESVETIRQQVGEKGRVITGLSGGVDSSVVGTLLHRAIGERSTCVFIDHGLLRKDEASQVMGSLKDGLGLNIQKHDYAQNFLDGLKGVTDPERKRKIIGEKFIRAFEKAAGENESAEFLAQGTLYPDVIESGGSALGPAVTIKSHHNVGGLPEDMEFELIEPIRDLFKDEVRKVGRELGLPEFVLQRHPFPGPGLAVRILGEITPEYLNILREADHIFIETLHKYKEYDNIWQAFAVLIPTKTVGVMGDSRTYENLIALRAVTSVDGMTADWYEIPPDLLNECATRIVNEVRGVNRVVYDITSKPPGTIEWE
ncbi:MAG: glutamine-hydrolyzing GMP synthase [Candidatus Marinimicrobia bacterium]|nr:glutamine-hydrolyzing GMP synthase [Candidatus Neomarinimicrobiota bacterium]